MENKQITALKIDSYSRIVSHGQQGSGKFNKTAWVVAGANQIRAGDGVRQYGGFPHQGPGQGYGAGVVNRIADTVGNEVDFSYRKVNFAMVHSAT